MSSLNSSSVVAARFQSFATASLDRLAAIFYEFDGQLISCPTSGVRWKPVNSDQLKKIGALGWRRKFGSPVDLTPSQFSDSVTKAEYFLSQIDFPNLDLASFYCSTELSNYTKWNSTIAQFDVIYSFPSSTTLKIVRFLTHSEMGGLVSPREIIAILDIRTTEIVKSAQIKQFILLGAISDAQINEFCQVTESDSEQSKVEAETIRKSLEIIQEGSRKKDLIRGGGNFCHFTMADLSTQNCRYIHLSQMQLNGIFNDSRMLRSGFIEKLAINTKLWHKRVQQLKEGKIAKEDQLDRAAIPFVIEKQLN